MHMLKHPILPLAARERRPTDGGRSPTLPYCPAQPFPHLRTAVRSLSGQPCCRPVLIAASTCCIFMQGGNPPADLCAQRCEWRMDRLGPASQQAVGAHPSHCGPQQAFTTPRDSASLLAVGQRPAPEQRRTTLCVPVHWNEPRRLKVADHQRYRFGAALRPRLYARRNPHDRSRRWGAHAVAGVAASSCRGLMARTCTFGSPIASAMFRSTLLEAISMAMPTTCSLAS